MKRKNQPRNDKQKNFGGKKSKNSKPKGRNFKQSGQSKSQSQVTKACTEPDPFYDAGGGGFCPR